MKVKELIRALEEQDPYADVTVFVPEKMYEDSDEDIWTTSSHVVPQASGAVEIWARWQLVWGYLLSVHLHLMLSV